MRLYVLAAELELVRGKMRRRMMRLPVTRDPVTGAERPCPTREATLLTLKAGDSEVDVTVLDAHRERLGQMTDKDARAEGYAGIQGALQAFQAQHGDTDPARPVWVIQFARGNHVGFMRGAAPVYLAQSGRDYTTNRHRAMPHEPEVIDPEVTARFAAAATRKRSSRRASEERDRLEGERYRMGDLHASMANMKARELVRRAERNLEAAARMVLSDAAVSCDMSPQMGAESERADLRSDDDSPCRDQAA